MKVLLFGASGQVGWRLKEQLGEDCVALTRNQCDFSQLNEKQARALIESHEPDIIVNAAAFTAVDAAEQQRDVAMQTNAHAPGILAKAAGNIPFIHLSTDYVFAGNSAPYNEAAHADPRNMYGESKWHGEQAILAAQGNSYIFRLQWIYDRRGSNFFLTMRKLIAERAALKVVADQFGAPSSAGSVATALIQAMKQIQQKKLAPGIYHLASGGYTSWHGFASAIAQATSPRAVEVIEAITTAEYPTPAERPHDTRLDCSALARHGIVLPHWRACLAQLMEEIDAHR